MLKDVFRSSTAEEMPMLEERLAILREAGQVLYEVFHHTAAIQHLPRTSPKSH